jgi:hypothetical protein
VQQYIGIGIALLAIVGGLGVAYYSMWLQSKARQLTHRERMAMIEKGMAPAELNESRTGRERSRRSQRVSGVFTICMGIGISIMMYFVNGPRSVWIGAFVAMFGLASLINSLWDERDSRRTELPAPRPPDQRL